MTSGSNGQLFGGDWTEQKLGILEEYLNAYTTALKKTSFRLVYIDAFAGSGKIALTNQTNKDSASLFEVKEEYERFIDGSAIRAINVDNKQFDVLVFVDIDSKNVDQLAKLKEDHPDRQILVRKSDANTYLLERDLNNSEWRGVLFLDPFGTQVSWTTIEHVANLEALDMWILFPTFALSRLLPTDREPDDINPGLVRLLNRVYGGEYWRPLYGTNESAELSGLGDGTMKRAKGTEGFSKIYKDRLESLFGDRFLNESKELKHPNGATLFELMFCVGNPSHRAISTAKNIAKHIIIRKF